jgi:hypothetical protein
VKEMAIVNIKEEKGEGDMGEGMMHGMKGGMHGPMMGAGMQGPMMGGMEHGGMEHGGGKMMMMWKVVKFAKFELLKDRVKVRLEQKEGKQLDEMADFLVEAALDFKNAKKMLWKKKMEMKERMMEIFMEDEGEEEG